MCSVTSGATCSSRIHSDSQPVSVRSLFSLLKQLRGHAGFMLLLTSSRHTHKAWCWRCSCVHTGTASSSGANTVRRSAAVSTPVLFTSNILNSYASLRRTTRTVIRYTRPSCVNSTLWPARSFRRGRGVSSCSSFEYLRLNSSHLAHSNLRSASHTVSTLSFCAYISIR